MCVCVRSFEHEVRLLAFLSVPTAHAYTGYKSILRYVIVTMIFFANLSTEFFVEIPLVNFTACHIK